jgi:hypothetical protein
MRADEPEPDRRPTVAGERAKAWRSPYPSSSLVVNPGLRVEGGRTYRGRSAAGHRIVTGEEAIPPDRVAEAEGKVGHAGGEDMEARQRPKGGATDRPRRER